MRRIDAQRRKARAERFRHSQSLASLRQRLAENDYNLNIPRYVDTFQEAEEIDLAAVRAEREVLKAELAELEARMDSYLKELGY